MHIAKIAAVVAFLGAFAAPGMASAYDYCFKYHNWHARQQCEWQRRHNNNYYNHGHDHDHDHDHDNGNDHHY